MPDPEGEPTDEVQSPIALPEVDPAVIDALYEKEALEITSEEIVLMCQDFRAKRAKWNVKETTRKTKGPTKKRTKAEADAAKVAAKNLTVDELLDL